MKKYIFAFLFVIIGLNANAQKDVTTFLGIPVDGYKQDMKKALIAKGFTPSTVPGSDCLEGEFNGTDVNVFIVTNNNKVYRLMIGDKNVQDAANIKIRFNNLGRQFSNNARYLTYDDFTLPEDENISYEMTVHNKIYEAIFYQKPDSEKTDKQVIQKKIDEELLSKYTLEQLANPTEEI